MGPEENNIGTLIQDTIRPQSPESTFAVAYANELRGGHHQVTSKAERNAITYDRLQLGMECTVFNVETRDYVKYKLVNKPTEEQYSRDSGTVDRDWQETERNKFPHFLYIDKYAIAGYDKYQKFYSNRDVTVQLTAISPREMTRAIMSADRSHPSGNLIVKLPDVKDGDEFPTCVNSGRDFKFLNGPQGSGSMIITSFNGYIVGILKPGERCRVVADSEWPYSTKWILDKCGTVVPSKSVLYEGMIKMTVEKDEIFTVPKGYYYEIPKSVNLKVIGTLKVEEGAILKVQ